MEGVDLSAWIGKPSGIAVVNADVAEVERSDSESFHSTQHEPPSPSESVGDVIEISQDAIDNAAVHGRSRNSSRSASNVSSSVYEDIMPDAQRSFYIDVPKLNAEEMEEFDYLPGHFTATKILSEVKGNRFIVKLESGETEMLTSRQLRQLQNGAAALHQYNLKNDDTRGARRPSKHQNPVMVDWTTLGLSDSDQLTKRSRRSRQTDEDDEVANIPEIISSDEEAGLDGSEDSNEAANLGRRSSRLHAKRRSNYFKDELAELDEASSDSHRYKKRRGLRGKSSLQPTRGSLRTQRNVRAELDLSSDTDTGKRRSERTRTKPRRNMRERQEDEISVHSEAEVGPKVFGAKEVFAKLTENDPFRKRHRQDCDTCNFEGDNPHKGPLVFCQGCTNSHHKSCLGPRGSRDHLVTKVGEDKFVLQCRRCIGVAHAKDSTAPHHGACAACNELGTFSKPLRARFTANQEQAQREENGGRDPITIVDPTTLNQATNVMFRCATCHRSWHMHHLPLRKTVHSQANEEEGEQLSDAELAQRRYDLYHRSWVCKDCIENQSQIDTLIAWRPVDVESYPAGYTVEMMEESKKEYLVKWRNQSYFRTSWMPGTWIWGIAASGTRAAFAKRPENQLPKMTTSNAIPEEYFRVDIVFDVRHSSVVRNSSKEIDMARAGEVDMAYVKYKGLGYEDAIWEKPPSFSDTERWKDFRAAYEDYVLKLHVSIPSQSTLRRHLLALRTLDFESKVARKRQPTTLTGGEIMQYQLEGMNWLLYQWYQSQNAILADEMGLGKTIQLIAFFANLAQEHKCWPFLVVVPNSTCPNWRREIKKWAPQLRVVTYYGSAVARKLTHDHELFPKAKEKERIEAENRSHKKRSEVKDISAHIVVASYESVTEEVTRKSLMRVPWQGLVVDEGQRLKNDKNLVYEALSKFRFPFKVLLTGTPLQNNVRELFNLLQFLDKSLNAAELEVQYANLTQENVPELHEQLRKFFLRRTKAQVLDFLPPMAQIIVPVTMSIVQKKVYKSILAKNPELMKSIISRDGAVATKDRQNLNNILMQLRKTLCHPFVYSRDIEERTYETAILHRNLVDASSKLQLLQIMLPKLKERGHRVLLFSQFLDNLDIVEDFLDGLGLMHRRLDGSINALEKQKRIDEFNAPESPYFAFLLSTRAGGVGINLATADTVILLDPDFNPHQDIQALSRAHRIGQKQKVLVFQLMTRGTAEEKIMQIGKKKMALDHVLIERMDQTEEAGVDLESILRHGAEALFDDDGTDDITYDSTSVDKLLDRSQIEDTKTSEDKSAESQFSFARIWANDKAVLEEGFQEESATGMTTPNPGIWDKILKERERAYAEEAARKAETLGRGKRKRQNVDYGRQDDAEEEVVKPAIKRVARHAEESDTDFQFKGPSASEAESTEGEDPADLVPVQPTIKARPFKRVRVPNGPAPYFSQDGSVDYVPFGVMPPARTCSACEEVHPMGWCRLKIAGVEHCGLCGLAHLGHGRTCPHLNSEAQVVTLLQALKQSAEPRDLVDSATKYLRMIRADLVQRKRNAERKRIAEEEAKRANVAAMASANATGLANVQGQAKSGYGYASGGAIPTAGVNGYGM